MSGTNYGLNDSLKYTEFEFDSLVAENSLDSQYFTTDWPLFLLGKPLTNVAAIKVIEAQIPFSYYVFSSTNNTFTLTETVSGVPASATVTIPVGNYTSTTILPALKTALQAASVVNGNSFTYTVTYSTTTMLITITNNDTINGDTFTLTFGSGLYDLGQTNPRLWLGFSGGANTSSPVTGTTAGTAILIAPSVINLTGPNYLYVCSRFLGPMTKLYLPAYSQLGVYGAGADGPQIAKIPMGVGVGGVENWQDPDPQKWFDLENLTNMAQIDLYCVLGTASSQIPLDFNGQSFSIKLGVLTNETTHNDYLGGGKQNERVTNRSWPTGAGVGRF